MLKPITSFELLKHSVLVEAEMIQTTLHSAEEAMEWLHDKRNDSEMKYIEAVGALSACITVLQDEVNFLIEDTEGTKEEDVKPCEKISIPEK